MQQYCFPDRKSTYAIIAHYFVIHSICMPSNYLKKILRAKVYEVAIVTPLDMAHSLSERLHNTVLLKREDLQSVFSFNYAVHITKSHY